MRKIGKTTKSKAKLFPQIPIQELWTFNFVEWKTMSQSRKKKKYLFYGAIYWKSIKLFVYSFKLFTIKELLKMKLRLSLCSIFYYYNETPVSTDCVKLHPISAQKLYLSSFQKRLNTFYRLKYSTNKHAFRMKTHASNCCSHHSVQTINNKFRSLYLRKKKILWYGKYCREKWNVRQ